MQTAEAWIVIEWIKPKYNWEKAKPKISKLYQTKPSEGLAVKLVLEFEEEEWEPTITIKLDPLTVRGSISQDEMRSRAKADAQKFLQENM